MRKQVKTWQVVETAAAISAGVAFFAGAMIAIYTFGIGIAFGIVGAAAGIATMVAAEIKTLRSQIDAATSKMNATTQQSASLAALNDQRPQKWGKLHKIASFFVAPYLVLKLLQYIDLQVDYGEVPKRSRVPNPTSSHIISYPKAQ